MGLSLACTAAHRRRECSIVICCWWLLVPRELNVYQHQRRCAPPNARSVPYIPASTSSRSPRFPAPLSLSLVSRCAPHVWVGALDGKVEKGQPEGGGSVEARVRLHGAVVRGASDRSGPLGRRVNSASRDTFHARS
jgi:hypothetical protein